MPTDLFLNSDFSLDLNDLRILKKMPSPHARLLESSLELGMVYSPPRLWRCDWEMLACKVRSLTLNALFLQIG